MNEPQTKDITIPPGALTTCPARRYALVSISGVCQGCTYSLGLWEVTEAEAPFADKYRVKCGVPQVREITMFQMGGEA